MNDMNRLLIFFLLAGLLYALYKYQHIIFGNELKNTIIKNIPGASSYLGVEEKSKKISYKPLSRSNGYKNRNKNDVNIDNISQLSIGSLENEDGNPEIYKPDSLLGSIGSLGSLGTSLGDGTDGGSDLDNMSKMTNDSSLFF